MEAGQQEFSWFYQGQPNELKAQDLGWEFWKPFSFWTIRDMDTKSGIGQNLIRKRAGKNRDRDLLNHPGSLISIM